MRVHTLIAALGLLALCCPRTSEAGHEAVPLNDYTRLGQRFTATQPFTALVVTVPSWSDDEGGLTLTLWESPERRQALAQQAFSAIADNAGVELVLAKAVPAGTYYWEIAARTGQTRIGLYADRLDTDAADCAYLEGVPDPRRRFLFGTSSPPFAYTDPAQMIATLTSAAPLAERQEACRLLAVMGGREAVPVLAPLLSDDALAHLARQALEGLPYAAVDVAFREALQTLRGPLRVGLINSIGVRRDTKAIRPLSLCLQDPDPAVASAAAAALGRIGTVAATAALGQALRRAPEGSRPGLWAACLDAAAQLEAAGRTRQARSVYDRLRAQETTATVRAAALRGAIVTRAAGGVTLLLESLRHTDPVMVSTALWVVQHELPGARLSRSLATSLPTLADAPQCALAQALCVRADPAALPALLESARHGSKGVRLTIIHGLPRFAGSPAADLLIDLLADPDAEIGAAAQAALSEWPGSEPDPALVARLAAGASAQRLVAIQLVGARGVALALPGLILAAQDADPALRQAALRVLQDLAGPADLPALLQLLVAARSSEDTEALERVLRNAGAKAPDAEAYAGMLIRLLPQAQPALMQALLRLLHGAGGSAACQAVLAATEDGDAEVVATAFRLLGEWRTPDAVPHLLRLAETSANPTGKLLSLRGCIRLAGSAETPVEPRLELCRRLVPLAQRDEEKKLLLGVLAGLPLPGALSLAQPYLDAPATRAEASAAILAVAEPLLAGAAAAEARAALQAVARSAPGTDPAQRAEALLSK